MGYYYTVAAAAAWTFQKRHFQWCYEAKNLHGHFKWYLGTLLKILRCFDYLGPNYGGKGGFFRLSHFFCVKANVIICYMGTFFQAMVLKLCTGFLDHITEYVSNFFAISSIRARIMGKKGFFQKWDLVIFSNFCVKVNVIICYMGTFF